jgi:hypothetical protein
MNYIYYYNFEQEGGLESVNLRYGAVAPIAMDISSSCGGFLNTEFNLTTTICAGGTPSAEPCKQMLNALVLLRGWH